MALLHAFQLLFNTEATWRNVRNREYSVAEVLVGHTCVIAMIPALAGFIGVTQVGWRIGSGDIVRLTVESGAQIAVASYFAMIVGVISVGWTIHWMSQTYGASQPMGPCMALATFTATPLFLIGIMYIYPVLWLDLLLGLPALAYTVYLFFSGVPIVMDIPPERAFLFAAAVMAFGLVALVAMLAVTALLWGTGLTLTFTS